jgi:predicted CopG family antitoxin
MYMATKTISIDLDAYERLKQAKRPNESFSEAIKRLVAPAMDVAAWLRELDENPLSDRAAKAIRKAIRSRSGYPRSGA